MIKLILEGGKYTLIQHDDGRMECLRYGEPWRDLTGDHLVAALLQAAQPARPIESKIAFGRVDFIFGDIAAAQVAVDGSISRTLNGVIMPPGTRLFVRFAPGTEDEAEYDQYVMGHRRSSMGERLK